LIKWGLGKVQDLADDPPDEKEVRFAEPQSQRATVIGAGPIGARVTTQLETMGKDVCLIDFSPVNLHPFTQAGFRTVAGDASDAAVLEIAEVHDSFLIVVCIPDDKVAFRIIRSIRRINRSGKLIVRCRYQASVDKLKKLGADSIIIEETEATLALLRMLENSVRT
jgi:CPA2 family monovalent cation:H+ antiporter-2